MAKRLSLMAVILALGIVMRTGICWAAVVEFAGMEACSMQVPREPLSRDVDTMLLAHLNAQDTSDADYARADRRQLATWAETAEGFFGGGASAATDAQWTLMYSGQDNIRTERGTVEFWVRSLPGTNIWADGEDRWFFSAYANAQGYPGRVNQGIGLLKSGADRMLHLQIDWPGATEDEYDLALPVRDLDPEQWHHIALSWQNAPPGHMALFVDGAGQRAVWGAEEAGPEIGFVSSMYLGPGGAAIDEVRIQSQPIDPRLAGHAAPAVDIGLEQLLRMQDAARAWLDFLIQAQQHGAIPITVNYHTSTNLGSPFSMLNDDSAGSLGHPFLWGYRIWGDQRYLRAACDLASFYARAQFPEGGWTQDLRVHLDGSGSSSGSIAGFEEWTQSNGIRALAACYHMTGLESFRQAALKAGEVILRAQDESGWWPWGAQIGAEDRRAGYMKGPTLNDWNLNACMGDCLVLYHMTGDERYVDAIFKAGEWIMSAQIEGPTPGWAAQYDMDGKPAWGRFMEPPAADAVFGTYGAGSGLLMLYDITGDERYLEPLRTHIAWLQSIPQEPKGWMWYAHRDWSAEENTASVSSYTESLTERFGATLPSEQARSGIPIKAGEPIVAYHYQMVPVDHPEVDCYLKPLNGHYGSRSENAEEWLAGELEKRTDGPVMTAWNGTVAASERQAARPTPTSCAAAYNPGSAAGQLEQLEAWRRGEPISGLLEAGDQGKTVHVGRGCRNATAVLRQVALAYAALGKASPDIIPMYGAPGYTGNFPLVDPARDWYDVPVPE